MALGLGAAYRFAMGAFAMRLYWRIGEDTPSEPGLMALCSDHIGQAVPEADAIWLRLIDEIAPRPLGYLIYDRATGKILHERRRDRPMPRIEFEAPKSAPESAAPWWLWLRF
jgi:hypothetical protein